MNDDIHDPDSLDVNNVTIDTSTITLATGTYTWLDGEDERSLNYAGYIEVEEDALVFVKANNPALHEMFFIGAITNWDHAEAIIDENNEQDSYWERVSGDGASIEQVYIKYNAADAYVEYEYDSVYMPDYDIILIRDDDEEEPEEP